MSTPTDAALFDVAWTTLKARRGETCTYHNGADSVSLTVVFTQPQANQVDGEENIVFQSREWDCLIDPEWPADAPAAFASYDPSHGDKIEKADGTIYDVQTNTVSDLCWRWSDGAHTWRRVHAEEQ